MIKRYLIAGLLAALSCPLFAAAPKPVVISIAGDSTVATNPEGSPQRGWGQYIQGYFDSGVVVNNFAKNGRSTKTFLNEGLWGQLIASKPDYVLIQFGHNDSHSPDHPEHTDAAGDYKQYLARFVSEARAIGAEPILVTPVKRRGKEDSLVPYALAMKEVAADLKVKVIDLHALSGALYDKLGPVAVEALEKKGDHTHFSELGARKMAALVIPPLLEAAPALGTHRVTNPSEPK